MIPTIPRFQLAAAALAGILVCSGAQGQARNATLSADHPAAAPAVQHPARVPANPSPNSSHTGARAQQRREQSGETRNSAAGRVNEGFSPTAKPFNFDETSGVPGLGFDFPHLAAVSRGRTSDSSEHFGHHGRTGQGSGFFVAIPFGGYAYAVDDQVPDQSVQETGQEAEQQPEQQPEQRNVQQAENQAQLPPQNSVAQQQIPAAAPDVAETPVPDIGDFILVRRDGRIVFASLFSVIGKQVRYITPDGSRRTLAIADLDSAATQEMNEARGSTVQIHD
jgi:hypothetical protein